MRRWPSVLRRRPHRSAKEWQRAALLRGIRRLPHDCRDVFVLHRFAEMSLDQIAEHMDVELQVVEARLAEALVRLSRAVDQAGAGGPQKSK